MKKFYIFFKDTVETVVVALLIALVVRAFLFQVFWIPSASMQPSFDINDRLIVERISFGIPNPLYDMNDSPVFLFNIPNPLYNTNFPLSSARHIIGWRSPARFEVIVFKYPKDPVGIRRDFIKRVIGLPNEELEIKDGIIYIDNQPLEETHSMFRDNFNMKKIKVPSNSYFVMGDNRPDSADSRYWGFVPKENIMGSAFLRIWPVTKFGIVSKN